MWRHREIIQNRWNNRCDSDYDKARIKSSECRLSTLVTLHVIKYVSALTGFCVLGWVVCSAIASEHISFGTPWAVWKVAEIGCQLLVLKISTRSCWAFLWCDCIVTQCPDPSVLILDGNGRIRFITRNLSIVFVKSQLSAIKTLQHAVCNCNVIVKSLYLIWLFASGSRTRGVSMSYQCRSGQ